MDYTLLEPLLKKGGLTSDSIAWTPLAGGRNNRVYRLDTPNGPVLLKSYFSGGDWDRMAAESRFLLFCEDADLSQVPRLLAWDEKHGLALHSWLAGERLIPGTLGDDDVAAAVAFLGAVAKASRRRSDGTGALLPARDACLSLNDYFRSPRERLRELEQALKENLGAPLVGEAWEFLEKQLIPLWKRVRESVQLAFAGQDTSRSLPETECIRSPSDFGFHNVLRLAGGGLGFVDFEYAGADDPAKAIGDFICQIDFPPPAGTCAKMAGAVCEDPKAAVRLMERVEILLPLFRVKFCCIILNEFKKLDAHRRSFALRDEATCRLENQLHKAKAYIKTGGDVCG